MNPTNGNAVTDPPAPPRSSFSCDRHPIEQFSTFCPACLCERLTTLDNNSSSNTPTSSQRPSSVSTAIKSLFSSIKPTSELRRSKSYSASKNEALGVCFEPQRKSCDVRVVRSEKRGGGGVGVGCDGRALSDVGYASSSTYQKGRGSVKIESFVGNEPVFEEIEDGVVAFVDADDDEDEIKPVPDCGFVEVDVRSSEIVEVEEEEEEEVDFGNLKPMKEHIELDYHGKKSVAGGGLRAAASVFGKKWNKWRRKQKGKKQTSGENSARVSVEKGIGRRYRETQSEVADYGFGRRSYDIDPRFSLDAGRISFDDPRYSVEEPQASWDGYVIGRRSVTRMAPMVSVMEDAPPIQKPRNDVKVPLEESDLSSANENGNEPGGSAQTREYYSDSSSRARKSLDRSSSVRKTAAAVINDLKMVSDTKISPTKTENLRDERLETFELDNDLRDDCNSVLGFGERKQPRKPKRWSWRIWDFIHRRYVGNKDEEKCDSVNGVERSLSESWQDLRRERNEFKGTMLRSNSSVSWRNAKDIGRSFDEMNGNGKKKNDEFVLEKNRSGRDSSFNPVNNGFLGFYLTPLRRSGRRVGLDKLKPNNSLSIARSVLKL